MNKISQTTIHTKPRSISAMIMVFIIPLLLISSIITSNQTIDLAFAKKHHSDNTGNSGTDTSGSGNSGTNDGVNWEDLCNSYHDILDLNAPCSTYLHVFELTQTGQTALTCLLGGAAGLLIPMDSATRAIVTGAAQFLSVSRTFFLFIIL